VARKIFQKIADAGNVEFSAIMEGLRFYVNKDDFREWAMQPPGSTRIDGKPGRSRRRAGIAKHNRHMAI